MASINATTRNNITSVETEEVSKISNTELKAMEQNSVKNLPSSPVDSGLKASAVQPKFYQFALGSKNSLFASFNQRMEIINSNLNLLKGKINADVVTTINNCLSDISSIVSFINTNFNNVNNTSDVNKPISNSTQNALNLKQNKTITFNSVSKTIEEVLSSLDSSISSINTYIGTKLNNVDNTSDVNKPISTATQTALNDKQNKSITFKNESTTIENVLTTLDGSITNVNSKNSEQDTTLSSLSTSINTINGQIATINTFLNGDDADLDTIKEIADSLKALGGALETQTNINDTLSSIATTYSSTKINSLLNEKETEIQAIQTQTTNLSNATYNKTETDSKDSATLASAKADATTKANEALANAKTDATTKANAVQANLDKHINKQEEVVLSSAFTTRITASDETNSKYEIKDKSIAKVNSISGYSKKSKQLLNIPNKEATTINGITYSINNGVITLNGTANAGTNIYLNCSAKINTNSLVNYFNNTIISNISVGFLDSSNSWFFNGTLYVINRVYTSTSTANLVKMVLYIPNGTTVNNLVVKPMLVEGTTVPTEFEAYYEGIKNAPVSEIKSFDENNNLVGTLSIPSEVQALEGYGWGLSTTDKSLNNYIDYENKTFVKNISRVDMGTLVYDYDSTVPRFVSGGLSALIKRTTSSADIPNALNSNYQVVSLASVYNQSYDKCLSVSTDGLISAKDTTYTNATDFKTAMSGQYLYYQPATPIVTDISQYLTDDTYVAYNYGTETLVGTEIPTLTEITYNANLDAQIVENADNIALLKKQHDEDFGNIPEWAKQTTKPTYTSSEVGAYSTEEIDTKLGDLPTYKSEIVKVITDQTQLFGVNCSPKISGSFNYTLDEETNSITLNANGSFNWATSLDYNLYLKKGDYTFSCEGTGDLIYIWDANGDQLYGDGALNYTNFTFTNTLDGYIKISFYPKDSAVTYSKIMLNKGTVKQQFKQYNGGAIVNQRELQIALGKVDLNDYAKTEDVDSAIDSIEQRLTNLGFSEGTVSLSNISGSPNCTLKKRGNYVIFNFQGGTLSSLFGYITIPEGFRPKETTTLTYCGKYTEYGTTNYYGTTLTIQTDGVITIVNPSLTPVAFTSISLSGGWETE